MDVLTSAKTKTYGAVSRYASFPYYYNTVDEKYIYGLTGQLATNVEYVAHKIKPGDTLDFLALKYYGRPDYFWIIADFNRIQDPFIDLDKEFDTIKIPSLGQIYFKD